MLWNLQVQFFLVFLRFSRVNSDGCQAPATTTGRVNEFRPEVLYNYEEDRYSTCDESDEGDGSAQHPLVQVQRNGSLYRPI